jgi:hypothetical protein
MDPRDRLRARLVGSSRTAWGAPTPRDRIRFVARRDELVFVRVGRDACGSEARAVRDFLAGFHGAHRSRIDGSSHPDSHGSGASL